MCKIAICDDDKEYREKIKTVIKTEGILRMRYGFMNMNQEKNYWKMRIFCMI